MSLPPDLFGTGFREHRLGLIFTVIMAIMVYFATLATAAQTSLIGSTTGWSRNVQSRLTVEIPADDAGHADAARTRKITAALAAIPEIAAATPVSESETARLLKPWIDDPALLKTLPMPALVDVQVREGMTMDADSLQRKLAALGEKVSVTSHAESLDRLLLLVRSLSLLAGLMAILTALALVVSISLISHTAMAVQHETIELLHLMGATNRAIARQFQKHIRKLSMPAALIGFVFAVATIVFLAMLLKPLDLNANWLTLGAASALTPLAAIAVATVSSRLFVSRLLHRLP